MAAAAGGSSSMATVAVFGSLCAGTFGLGCWQATRYFEKVEMIQVREKELSMNASPLPPSSTSSPTSFQKYTVRGKFRHDNEVWIGPRGPPPGAMASSGPNSGRSSGGMSTSPQVCSIHFLHFSFPLTHVRYLKLYSHCGLLNCGIPFFFFPSK